MVNLVIRRIVLVVVVFIIDVIIVVVVVVFRSLVQCPLGMTKAINGRKTKHQAIAHGQRYPDALLGWSD